MSEFERGKYYGKKKYSARSDRSDSKSTYTSRYYNKNIYNPDKDTKEPDAESKSKVKQPQILIKTRENTEDRSISPRRGKEENATAATQKETPAAHSAAEKHSPPTCTIPMVNSAKLLDENGLDNEGVQEYLNDMTDFLVVGVIGPQGSGKTTIMNLLAADKVTDEIKKELFKSKTNDTDDDGIKILTENVSKFTIVQNGNKQRPFSLPTPDQVESCLPNTTGIDMFITDNRMILLDCQPFLSIPVCDENTRSDLKHPGCTIATIWMEKEVQGLQYIAFLMSVCHVLIFTQDYFFDSNNLKFLHTAEMLKPTMLHNDEIFDPFPHLLILQNRAQMEDFSPSRFKMMQQVYKTMLSGSKMHLESGLGMGSGKLIPALNPSNCGERINFFLFPEYSEEKELMYRGHPPFEELVKNLKMHISGVTKYRLTHVQLTEKMWLAYCQKIWYQIKISQFFVEYLNLMMITEE